MAYIYLGLAITGELIGTTLLKYSNGFKEILPSIGCLVSYALCFFVFSKALKGINLSLAYATWSGLGIIAATTISVMVFKENISTVGIVGIILVILGVILLNFFGTAN